MTGRSGQGRGEDAGAPSPASVSATFCSTLVDEWVRGGVTDAVVCPGSRSTPMALALAADGRVRIQVHHDERSAAFIALGMGLASGRPAIVLTTSGTAAVELHPAVVEACYAQVPLIAVTADRPPELQGVGAPQTIDQVHLFGSAVRSFHEPGVAVSETSDGWRPIAAQVLLEACGSQGTAPGPVHLNLAFREPLVATPAALPSGRGLDRPWLGRPGGAPAPNDADIAAVAAAVRGRRGVIVAGGGAGDPHAVCDLALALGWPLLADPRSGCRLPLDTVMSHFDSVLRSPSVAARLLPEVVVRIGALPASKVLGQWLAASGAWQVGVEAHGAVFDPFHDLASVVAAEPGSFCARLVDELGCELGSDSAAPVVRAPDDWTEAWISADSAAASAIRVTLASFADVTEPATARAVVAALPDDSHLVVSSSMPIRDVEWYAVARDALTIHSNRGANGIDGVLSTAVGVALATARPTAALLGDVAFLHDANALIGIARRGIDLVIVVVDNDGGGIFSFLPQAASMDPERFEQLFGTPHGVDVGALGRAHGLRTELVVEPTELTGAIEAAAVAGGVHLIVARTDRHTNVGVHDEIHRAVAEAMRVL